VSLDLFLTFKPCPTCGQCKEGVDWNYTYNVAPMWYAVFPDSKNMLDIDGMTGKESVSRIESFVTALEAEPERFKAMEPNNGWGSYDSFLKALKSLIEIAEQNPDGMWRSWR